jgi:predicted phage terminase large subunit-like protein
MALDPDYTVGVLMSRDKTGFFYIEDVVRIRGSAHEVERLIKNTALLDGKHVRIRIPQDPGQAGKAQAAYLVRQLAGYTVKAVSPSGAKETRAAPFAAQAEAGNVKLLQAPWNRQFLDELCVFPAGAHDDVVDAASDAFAELVEPERKALIRDMKWHEKPGDPYWKR